MLSAEQEKASLLQQECDSVREGRKTLDKKLDQMQRRLHRVSYLDYGRGVGVQEEGWDVRLMIILLCLFFNNNIILEPIIKSV